MSFPSHIGDARPLLTVAIPTFNRPEQLATLLAVLEVQLRELPPNAPLIEIFVSNNASADDTQDILTSAHSRFLAAGLLLNAHHHAENIGSDANFAFCFRRAQGTFSGCAATTT
jgi:abequosyltransferase